MCTLVMEDFLLAGDFNVREGECSLKDFMGEFHAKNLVKEETCFKNIENPCDLFDEQLAKLSKYNCSFHRPF